MGPVFRLKTYPWLGILAIHLFLFPFAQAIELQIDSLQSLKDAAGAAAYGMMAYYNANETGVGVPGNLPAPYYWWEAGAMMMSLIDYWSYTGDSTYNEQVIEAIEWQASTSGDFMTSNQTLSMGNDDQAFWAFAALEAAELRFPDPPVSEFSWLSLAQGVFNSQIRRWGSDTCGGGLRWQVFNFNKGWNYKNSISNGGFINIGARLGRYTNNQTYADWVVKGYDWSKTIGIISDDYHVYDGTDVQKNCSDMNHLEYSYAAGVYLHTAANMWNWTQAPVWKQRVDGFLAQINSTFFQDGVMKEVVCEDAPNGSEAACNVDMQSFKAYLTRWLAATTQLCPWTATTIIPLLQTSAEAAALQCSGGPDGRQCGLRWTERNQYDGKTGVGEQMSAMSVFGANLIAQAPGPVTHQTGGTSLSNPNQGSESDSSTLPLWHSQSITTADRAGAGILTVLLAGGMISGFLWLVL